MSVLKGIVRATGPACLTARRRGSDEAPRRCWEGSHL